MALLRSGTLRSVRTSSLNVLSGRRRSPTGFCIHAYDPSPLPIVRRMLERSSTCNSIFMIDSFSPRPEWAGRLPSSLERHLLHNSQSRFQASVGRTFCRACYQHCLAPSGRRGTAAEVGLNPKRGLPTVCPERKPSSTLWTITCRVETDTATSLYRRYRV